MKSTIKFLYLISFLKCFLGQEEFNFGGAAEEEDEKTPNITFSTNDVVIKSEMQFLYVVCNISNFPPNTFTIRWLDSNDRVIASNNLLFIKSVLKKNEGQYHCSVDNKKDGGKKFQRSLNLTVTVPNISIEILADESLRIGGKVLRQCSDFGMPTETIVDQFTYKWLNQQNNTIGNSKLLEIPIVDNSINGKYICQYESKETSKIYEATTLVDLKQATDYSIKIVPNPSTIHYGERFSLRCEVQPLYNNIKYKWYKNNELISSDQELLFKSFKKDNVGIYKCVAGLMLKSGLMNLEAESVQQFTLFRQNKIELTEKPGPHLFVHIGEKKELHCEIETNLNMFGKDTIWYINGKILNGSRLNNVIRLDRQYVSMLVINDIKSENEGNYECRVGSSYKEVNLVVLFDEGIIETSPPLLKVQEGQAIEFHCRAENIPNVKNTDVKWRFQSKDGAIKYSIPDSRWVVSNPNVAEQTSFIDLQFAQVTDSGYYICTEPNGRTATSELIVIPNKEATFVTITPKEIRVRSGQRVDIECFTKNTQGRASGLPQFHFTDNRPLGRDSRFVVSNVGPAHIRLSAPSGLSLSDNNMTVDCTSSGHKVTAKIYVKDICPPGYRYCQNGQCLENSKFCDKVIDCTDGSDENPISCRECDPISQKCEMHNGEIPRKAYYLMHWICDGEDDCGNGFDEINCGNFAMNNCGGRYFNCSDGKSIPRGFVCDDNVDCPGGEDESECTSPQVTKTSETRITVRKSQEVIMKCEAKGKPLPVIIWRFNWGCIQNSTRFSTTFYSNDCNTVSSDLIIKDFKPGDDGIYNCEALSSRQRSFSNDFQVILENN